MNKPTPLSAAAFYSKKRVTSRSVTKENFISVDNIMQNRMGIAKAVKIPSSTSDMSMYDQNHILIGNIRPYLKKIWFANRSGGCSSDVLNLEVKEGYDPKFVYYALFRDDFFNHMMKGSKGSKMPRGDKNQVLDFLLPNFNISVQQKISSVLSVIDNKIELNNKINSELEALAKLIYDFWFVQFDFPDQNGKPYKSSGGKMVWCEELKRMIPEGWNAGGFDDIGDVVGGSTPSRSNDEFFTQNGIAWITPKDLSLNFGKKFISKGETDVTDLGIKNASLNLLSKGTVLLSSRAPIGYTAISRNEVTTNQGFKSIIPKDQFSTEYVFYTVQLYIDAMIQYASGSTFSEISASTLKMIRIPIPDNELIRHFTKKVGKIFAQQDILEQQNEKLEQLRDWLLPMLMNGQVKLVES